MCVRIERKGVLQSNVSILAIENIHVRRLGQEFVALADKNSCFAGRNVVHVVTLSQFLAPKELPSRRLWCLEDVNGKIEYDRAVRWRQKRTRVSEASSPRSAQCSSANTVLDADNTKRGLSIFWFPCGTRLTGTSKHFQTPCNWRSQTAVQTGDVRIVLRVLCLSDRGMWSVSCHRPQFRDDPRIEAVRRRTVVAHRNYKRLSVVGARLP